MFEDNDQESTNCGKSTAKHIKFLGNINNCNGFIPESCDPMFDENYLKTNNSNKINEKSPRPTSSEIEILTQDILKQMSQIKNLITGKWNFL